MKFCQSFYDLNENIPDILLIELASFFFMFEYFLQQVSSICVLHDNAKAYLIKYHNDFELES